MSSLNESIKFYLNIEDPNIIFSDYFKKWINGKYHNLYLAELIQPYCPYYHSSNLKQNGHYTSKRKILSALTEDRSMTSIAREHNVSINTVQRVLEACSSKFYDDFDHLPEHLAFDEFKGVGKKLHFICLDGDTHKVVQILRTRFKPDILHYFYKFTPKARAMVKTVTMDLNCYYPLVARELFPNAQIVIDRFHMVQMLTRSFNIFRVQIMKQFNKSSREYKLLKSPWKLYLMRYDKLNRTTPYYDWHFKDYLTQEHVVLDSLDCDPTLENTYWVMQDFMVVLKELTVRLNKLNVLLMAIEILVIF